VSGDSSSDKTAAASRPDVAIIFSCKSVPGGAQQVALNIAEEFTKRGKQVDLIALSRKGEWVSHIPAGVRVFRVRSRARGFVFRLRRYLRTEKPSTVISFSFHINILSLVSSIGLRPRPRLILTVHSTLSLALRELSSVKRALLFTSTAILYRLADVVVAVSQGAADDLIRTAKVPRERVKTIHNPVIRDDFRVPAEAKGGHDWIGDKGSQLVVAAGRLTPAKDYPTLIHAFHNVAARTDARLLILGQGDMLRELQALVHKLNLASKVEFAGHVENPLSYMNAGDVFVLSSKREGFANVLVEAMATGTPVISTDCPHGPREILSDGKWGKLVPVGDSNALADAILEVLRYGGIDARARARKFTVEAAADSYFSLL
jgi:glycosyltransferase involved in cell wall biosynthesis